MKKNRLLIFVLLLTVILTTSCEDNFDPKIYGKLYKGNFPATEADYEAYMMTAYLPFISNWRYYLSLSSGQYGFYIVQGQHRLFDLTSDYSAPWLIKSWGASWLKMSQANYADQVYTARSAGDDTPNFEKIRDITRITEIIGTLEQATVLPEAKKKQFIAEARICRGMIMYYLLHIYGPLPVILDPALVGDVDAGQNMVRPTLDEMSAWITEDLEYAVQNLPATAISGRYTADYARFCLMRHCLNEGAHMSGYYDKSIAMYNQLKSSAKYGLFTQGGANAYADLFKQANKFNKEIIMAVSTGASAGTGGYTNGNYNPLMKYCVPNDASKYADAANTIPTPFVNMGGGWAQNFNISPKYYDSFDSNDTRKNVVLTSYVQNNAARTVVTRADINVKWSGFIINKYPVENSSVSYQPTDIPLARWADVLLMYAEAVARKSQTVPSGEAMDGVNAVRARAGLAPLSGTTLSSYTNFMDALLAERGHELIYEGCRKIDLIRFNKYRHNCILYKGEEPTHQYMPLPNFAVEQAASYEKDLAQYFERPDYGSDR